MIPELKVSKDASVAHVQSVGPIFKGFDIVHVRIYIGTEVSLQ